MNNNAKDNLIQALEELCACEEHLNIAYIHAEDESNKEEIHIALKAMGNALNSAQTTLENYKD
ncbi:hypothetical protein [Clostridium sp.]|uniref:hypothetical protein n=1 Tax=Clostridium sp. TaxID=1506 RepID=UPI003F3DEF32